MENNNPFSLLHPYRWVLFSSSSASFSIFPQHTACWIRSLRLKLRALLIVGIMICCLLCAPVASWGTDSTLKRSCYDSHCLQDQAVLPFPRQRTNFVLFTQNQGGSLAGTSWLLKYPLTYRWSISYLLPFLPSPHSLLISPKCTLLKG